MTVISKAEDFYYELMGEYTLDTEELFRMEPLSKCIETQPDISIVNKISNVIFLTNIFLFSHLIITNIFTTPYLPSMRRIYYLY